MQPSAGLAFSSRITNKGRKAPGLIHVPAMIAQPSGYVFIERAVRSPSSWQATCLGRRSGHGTGAETKRLNGTLGHGSQAVDMLCRFGLGLHNGPASRRDGFRVSVTQCVCSAAACHARDQCHGAAARPRRPSPAARQGRLLRPMRGKKEGLCPVQALSNLSPQSQSAIAC